MKLENFGCRRYNSMKMYLIIALEYFLITYDKYYHIKSI